MLKIDCHTHIVNKEIRDDYFGRPETKDSYAIVLEFLQKFRNEKIVDNSWDLVRNDDRLFLCPVIDLTQPIPEQLAKLEGHIEENRIVGLKVFLTYQKGRADEDKLMPMYDFAEKHNLTMTYHTGLCSLVLPSDGDMEGSNAIFVANVAERYPNVNFVVAHMDDPRYKECIQIVHEHKNMYTDFSGAFEPGTPEGADQQWAMNTFAEAIHQYDDMYKQILYGTDFCPPINLFAMKEFDETVALTFKPEYFEDVYSRNCLRAYPRLKEYIK